MKKEELEKKILEAKKKSEDYGHSAEKMANFQVNLTELYIQIMNEFNEKANIYNNRLLWFTGAVCFLAIIQIIIMFLKK